MSGSNGKNPTFRLELSGAVADQVKAVAAEASRQKRLSQFKSDFSTIVSILRRAPQSWGEPAYELDELRLSVRRGVLGILSVYYGVEAQAKIVYLKTIQLLPPPRKKRQP